jgi:hypothetical protein
LFEWKGKQQKMFDLLKGKFLSTSVLWFQNFAKPFEVHIDATRFVIGGVFM